MKLYGEAESNELVDESSSNDGFAELEDVISKVGKIVISRNFFFTSIFFYCSSCIIAVVLLTFVVISLIIGLVYFSLGSFDNSVWG